MFYEYRVYEAMPGKFPQLNDRFAKHTLGLFKKHGIGTVGFWHDEIGISNNISYIWYFNDIAERDVRLAAFLSDPEWLQVVAETEADGPLVSNLHNSVMYLTPYSPEPRMAGNVHELRVYEPMAGKLHALNERFANHNVGLFKKHGLDVMAYWTQGLGNHSELRCIVNYESMDDRVAKWTAFSTDPEWYRVMMEAGKNGPIMARIRNSIMRPTSYSPRG